MNTTVHIIALIGFIALIVLYAKHIEQSKLLQKIIRCMIYPHRFRYIILAEPYTFIQQLFEIINIPFYRVYSKNDTSESKHTKTGYLRKWFLYFKVYTFSIGKVNVRKIHLNLLLKEISQLSIVRCEWYEHSHTPPYIILWIKDSHHMQTNIASDKREVDMIFLQYKATQIAQILHTQVIIQRSLPPIVLQSKSE